MTPEVPLLAEWHSRSQASPNISIGETPATPMPSRRSLRPRAPPAHPPSLFPFPSQACLM